MNRPSSRPLRVWIVQNGEELPSDPGPPRLLRQALLARLLATRGHEVTFWTPSFNHLQKLQRTTAEEHCVSDGYRVMLLKSRPYERNVSGARIRSHRDAGREFSRRAAHQPTPDVVVAGYPTIELAHAAVTYAGQRGVPSIVDFRDQWPDIWSAQLPPPLRPVAAPLISRWRRLQRETVCRGTSICGITDQFVEWALAAGGRPRGVLDRAFHLAPPAAPVDQIDLSAAYSYWTDQLGTKPPTAVWGAYAGSLSRRIDIMTVVRATALLPPDVRSRLKIVVCGSGGAEPELREAVKDNDTVFYAGRRGAAEVRALLEQADFGLIPYIGSSDFLMSYPNKLGEQLSYGLPIVTGLGGVTGALLREHTLSTTYTTGDPHSCARALIGMVKSVPGGDVSHRARQLFLHAFNPDTIYPDYANHVELVASSVVGNRRPTP